MDDREVERLRRWAVSRMKWERDVAKIRGTRIKPVKGVTKLNAHIQTILSWRHHRPGLRAKAATEILRQGIEDSFK